MIFFHILIFEKTPGSHLSCTKKPHVAPEPLVADPWASRTVRRRQNRDCGQVGAELLNSSV